MRRHLASGLIAFIGLLVAAAPASAHPLGNFTTNVHVGLEVTPDRLQVTVVVDMAEIPAFRELAGISDVNPPTESATVAYADRACRAAGEEVYILVDGVHASVRLDGAQMTLPAGEAGLATLRLECRYESDSVGAGTVIEVHNDLYVERFGWAEIVAWGSGVRLASEAPEVSPTGVLTNYPDGEPLVVRTAIVRVGSDSEATSLGTQAGMGEASVGGIVARLTRATSAASAPPALLAAVGLGVAHALAPGHGKTLMAAFLVGRGGRPRHAVALGLSVAVTHTIGVALLGLVTLIATSSFQPDQLYPWLSGISAVVITVIGVVMLVRVLATHHDQVHQHGQGHGHGHNHDHHHHGADHDHRGGRVISRSDRSGWRSLAGLGLAGGIVPSASAVILLLSGVGAGRPAFGLLMVFFFGLGMSLALVATGLAVVGAYRFGGRFLTTSGQRHRLTRLTQTLAALAVTGIGLFFMFDLARSI